MNALIVEDDQDIAKFIDKGLKIEGFVTQVAFDGEEALDLIESNDYDVVILDLMLPKISGEKVLSGMREEGINTPVIVLTAKTEISSKVEALDHGADDYLTKPFA